MAACTRNARFELRRNSSVNWTSVNPLLLAGEPGVELDTGQMKIGDGIRSWNDLPYVGRGGFGAGDGTTGPTGPTGNNSLGFINDLGNTNNSTPTIAGGDPNQRDLEIFYDADGPKQIRRWIQYTNAQSGLPMFALVLASFTPTVSASFNEANLNWDQPSTGFNVSVGNPFDFTTKYISDIARITAVSGGGTVGPLSAFTAQAKVLNPSTNGLTGGVSWTQSFNVNLPPGYIYSNGSAGSGGYAQATVQFIVNTAGVTGLYTTTIPTITVNWNNPSSALSSSTSLTGKQYLESYDSANYTISVYNLSFPATNSASVISTNLTNTISPSSGSGTFSGTLTFSPVIDYARYITFTGTPSNKPTISAVTTFTKPPNITGTAGYTFQYTPSSYVFNASWIFPSFLTWTDSTYFDGYPGQQLVTSDIINTAKTAFNAYHTRNLNNPATNYPISTYNYTVNTYVGFVTNPKPGTDSAAVWFGVYSGHAQPTRFAYAPNASSTTISDVSTLVVKFDLDLSPAGTAPNTVVYKCYGYTMQSGQTYLYFDTPV